MSIAKRLLEEVGARQMSREQADRLLRQIHQRPDPTDVDCRRNGTPDDHQIGKNSSR